MRKLYINALELKAAKFVILAFTQNRRRLTSILIQMENLAALSHLLKMGEEKNPDLVGLSKQIWNYPISKQIIFKPEHLAGILNVEADFDSRNVKDSSEYT